MAGYCWTTTTPRLTQLSITGVRQKGCKLTSPRSRRNKRIDLTANSIYQGMGLSKKRTYSFSERGIWRVPLRPMKLLSPSPSPKSRSQINQVSSCLTSTAETPMNQTLSKWRGSRLNSGEPKGSFRTAKYCLPWKSSSLPRCRGRGMRRGSRRRRIWGSKLRPKMPSEPVSVLSN